MLCWHIAEKRTGALVYTSPREAMLLSGNPNGSIGNMRVYAMSGANVFGLMPHPERYVSALQHPAAKHGDGDGLLIFKNAYEYAKLQFDRRQYKSSYAASGVDIAAADAAKELMKDAVRSTHGVEVLAGMGAFRECLTRAAYKQMRRPTLVASTDGVGTKTLIERRLDALIPSGHDLVNHSVNDLLCQEPKPLFFMDSWLWCKLDPVQAAMIVRGVAEACARLAVLCLVERRRDARCYLPGAFDLAEPSSGVAEQDRHRQSCQYLRWLTYCSDSLQADFTPMAIHCSPRFAPYALDTVFPELGGTTGQMLSCATRCYLKDVEGIRKYLADRVPLLKDQRYHRWQFCRNIARILLPVRKP